MTDESAESSSSSHQLMGKVIGLVLFLGILCAPPPADLPVPAQRLAAVTALMAALWVTQALPIAVTSLIPLVAFPLLGIQSAAGVSQAYVDQNIFLFMGGFIIALGIEKWGLHQRIALHVVRLLGTSPSRMVLGFMLATAFLSMWISNTATTLLMLPIGLALTTSLGHLPLESSDLDPDQFSDLESQRAAALGRFRVVLLLSIAYAASIGGFTTLVGTPTNVAFLNVWEAGFPKGPEISAGQWMAAVVPIGAVFLLLTWIYLTWRMPAIPGAERLDRGFFTARLHQLGRPRQAEWLMLLVFVGTALLWMLRTPLTFGNFQVLPGWQGWMTKHTIATGLHDSTVAMGMALLLFVLPARRDDRGRTEFLMDWKTAERLPWGILLLFGGGFALAAGFQQTGLSEWLGETFARQVGHWPPWLLIAAVCFLLTFLTELTSNTATLVTVAPVLGSMAVAIGLDPRLVMIPATISTSCAFMLPIATPPNAIVFASNKIPMGQMVRTGIALNLIGVVLVTAATFWLIVPIFGISLDSMPEWATPPLNSP